MVEEVWGNKDNFWISGSKKHNVDQIAANDEGLKLFHLYPLVAKNTIIYSKDVTV